MTVFADYCIDFDGVLHQYTSPWTNARTVSDGAVPGAIEALCGYVGNGEKAAVYSARSGQWGGRRAMKAWLRKQAADLWNYRIGLHGGADLAMELSRAVGHSPFAEPDEGDYFGETLVKRLLWPRTKPSAKLYVDDRAYHFTGRFPALGSAADFVPWNRAPSEAPANA